MISPPPISKKVLFLFLFDPFWRWRIKICALSNSSGRRFYKEKELLKERAVHIVRIWIGQNEVRGFQSSDHKHSTKNFLFCQFCRDAYSKEDCRCCSNSDEEESERDKKHVLFHTSIDPVN